MARFLAARRALRASCFARASGEASSRSKALLRRLHVLATDEVAAEAEVEVVASEEEDEELELTAAATAGVVDVEAEMEDDEEALDTATDALLEEDAADGAEDELVVEVLAPAYRSVWAPFIKPYAPL